MSELALRKLVSASAAKIMNMNRLSVDHRSAD